MDVRLIAATHRNLGRMIEDNQFRADLFYRLNVFPIMLPPLRERSEDIPDLVQRFVERYSRRDEQEDPPRSRLSSGGAYAIRLAGEYSGTAKLHRACRHSLSRGRIAGSAFGVANADFLLPAGSSPEV